MAQSTDQTNADFTGSIAAAQTKCAAEVADAVREGNEFVLSRGPGSSPYVQPGACDVTDSLGGLAAE